MSEIVVIGGGHAGAQVCQALAAAGLGARVHLVCGEAHLPYHRPPLSKGFQKTPDEPLQWHRQDAWFGEQGITVHRSRSARSLDRDRHTVTLDDGRVLPYEWLVLATGSRARRLAELPEGLSNVHVLRSADDAARLRAAWPAIHRFTVVGGGFIGLEVAATARALGKEVQVLEVAPRLMLRSVSPELSAHVLEVHRAAGIDIRTGVTLGAFHVEGDRLVAIEVDGERQPVDALLLGVGAVPEQGLAADAGLACDNGIVVDEHMVTSDPAILAIGDCASFPEWTSGRRVRLESVQNANDQAKTAAATIVGPRQPHRAVPWFWSEQGAMRMQMAGLMPPDGTAHRRPGAQPGSFSILHYAGDRLACVESVNAPMDHMAARKLLETGANPDPAAACDPAVALRQLAGS